MAPPDVVDVLWITAALGCDGDTISMTAATQPSIEELIAGAMPGVPRLRLHNPVLARENADEFMRRYEEFQRNGWRVGTSWGLFSMALPSRYTRTSLAHL